MSQAVAKFKKYIQDLLRKTKRFSLVELMGNLETVLVTGLFGTKMFNLVKPYYREIDVLSSRYNMQKRLSKDMTHRKELRKETAKNFFDIVERLGAIIPKWLLAMPEHLKECDFDKWKTETSKGENIQLAECIKDFSQFCHLRKKLLEIGEVLVETNDNRRLRKLVIHKIETEVKDDVGDVQIGTPTVVKK